ncbi:MAG: TonB-dependent receptor plug domain-containing protein [Cellvibrionaceae bacterium]
MPASHHHRLPRSFSGALAGATAPLLLASASLADNDMLALSLEQLMDMDVTVNSASKSDEKIMDVPSAIYVISQEDIRRAGITSIPEALRMAPGLHVAQITSNEWAVSARGLNGRFSRYLLVLIDGRSVYSSMFSGVNWDEHNLIMADIDRIEVIRGPGATVWGANAVNGVINIITRHPNSEDKSTLTLRGGVGEKAHLSGTHSGQWGDMEYRLSGQYSEIEGLHNNDLDITEKDWNHSRVSWQGVMESGDQVLRLTADLAQSTNYGIWPEIEPGIPFPDLIEQKEDKNQYSLQADWKTQLSSRDTLEVKLSNDRTKRHSNFWDWETRNTDAEVLWGRQFDQGQTHLGFNYRWTSSDFADTESLSGQISPNKDTIELYSLFGQLQYRLLDDLEITLGAKYESHSETGDNFQPTVRAIWSIDESQRFWIAASKAVATPSRTITETTRIDLLTLAPSELPPDITALLDNVGLGGLPVNISIENRGIEIDNTEIVAVEMGYRFQWKDKFTVELALYDNQYENLISTAILLPEVEFNPAPYVNFPVHYLDEGIADARGVELNASWKVTHHWLLKYSGSYINFDPSLAVDNGVEALERLAISEDTPTSQHSLRSYHTLSDSISLNLWFYYYGEMKDSDIDDFTSANAKIEWRPNQNLSLALLGKNLLDSSRSEFYREIFYTGDYETEKTISVEMRWSFD